MSFLSRKKSKRSLTADTEYLKLLMEMTKEDSKRLKEIDEREKEVKERDDRVADSMIAMLDAQTALVKAQLAKAGAEVPKTAKSKGKSFAKSKKLSVDSEGNCSDWGEVEYLEGSDSDF